MGAIGKAFGLRRACLRLEPLETRQLLSGFAPSAAEQLFLEELNDARANPAAYGASIGVDLSGVAPSQPLAFNPALIQAARLHSQDMNDQGYFAHISPQGASPGDRISAAGFAWTGYGESIAGGTAFPGPSQALSGLIIDAGVPDLGHRRQLLAIDAIYQNQNQVGIGVVQNGTGPLVDYYTVDSASANGAGPFLTGVIFNDANHNGQYDIGEGLGGVTITVAGIGSTLTWGSGGYSLAVAPGAYTVTASGGGLSAPISQTVSIGLSNSRLNFVAAANQPINPQDQQYVVGLYQTILGRTPSAGEIAPWAADLQSPMGRLGVASAIEHSPEARTRLVKGWYQTYLGRTAINGEEQFWVNAMVSGATEEDVLGAILGSPEFYNRSGKNGSGTANTRYITTLYAVLLHRTASAGELNLWLQAFPGMGANGVAAAFAHSVEYRNDVIASYYTGILHRTQPPLAGEIGDWANTNLDFTGIRAGFESSNEFFASV
jgi:uncharacterized protein YkwD